MYGPFYVQGFLTLRRARYDSLTSFLPQAPREQLSSASPWIDGSIVYGDIKPVADALRSFQDGRMAESRPGFPRRNINGLPTANNPVPALHKILDTRRHYLLGAPGAIENPALTSLAIMWVRNHNWHAERLKALHPTWNDEELFLEARKMVLGELQKITFYDWLPAYLGSPVPAYAGYDGTIDPRVSHVFQSAAMRFGHTLVTTGVYRRDTQCNYRVEPDGRPAYRMCNSYFEPNAVIDEYDNSTEELWLGMSSQLCEREDNIVVEDLRGFVFGPLEAVRRDLMALNIQRSRDHGLPSYNVARAGYGLPIATHFENITTNATLVQRLKDLHQNDLERVDIWTGGLLETVDGPGPLFSAIILDQFLRIRNGDRFWFENDANGLYEPDELQTILNTTLKDIMVRVSRGQISDSDLQDDVFHFNSDTDPCESPGGLAAEDLEPCTNPATIDFYDNSEWELPAFLLALGFGLIALIGTIIGITVCLHRREAKREASREAQDASRTGAEVTSKGSNVPKAYLALARSEHGRPVSLPPAIDGCWPAVILRPGGSAFAAYLRYNMEADYMAVFSTNTPPPQGSEADLSAIRIIKPASVPHIFVDSNNSGGVILRSAPGFRSLWAVLSDQHVSLLLQRFVRANHALSVSPMTIKAQHKVIGQLEDEYEQEVSHFLNGIVSEVAVNKGHRTRTGTTRATLAPHDRTRHTKAAAAAGHHGPNRSIHPARSMRRGLSQRGSAPRRAWGSKFGRTSGSSSRRSRLSHASSASSAEDDGVSHHAIELDLELFASLLGVAPSEPVAQRLYAFVSRNSRKEGNSEALDTEAVRAAVGVLLSTSPEAKLEALFNMYAPEGLMTLEGLQELLKEMAQWGGIDDEKTLHEAVQGVGKDAQELAVAGGLAFDRFVDLLSSHGALKEALMTNGFGWSSGGMLSSYQQKNDAKGLQGSRASKMEEWAAGELIAFEAEEEGAAAEASFVARFSARATRLYYYATNRRREIGVLAFFWITTALIFYERYWRYSDQRIGGGLRGITGQGVAVTRGGASAMMWTFSLALLPMCRNLMTALRSTFLRHAIPFDKAVAFHKIAALTGGLFVLVHLGGHVTNFYKISTQPAANMMCVLREVYWYSDFLPGFAWWLFRTVTGVTGVILTIVTVLIFVFASPWSRRFDFDLFWTTHQLYVLFYIMMIAHGAAHLVQQPIFWQYFIGPALLFTFDKLITLSTASKKLKVIEAQLLPAGVIALYMEKPPGFNEVAGQWVRLRVGAVASQEWHPFTISSAPHENFVSLHIRGVGPWTKKCREVYRLAIDNSDELPPAQIQGPYGEGYQEWDETDVAVLVGAGIGVTPFVSIVKDLGERIRRAKAAGTTGRKAGLPYVYFMWIARTQRQYEWLVEICKEVEEVDDENLLEVHVFLTAEKRQADFRTAVARALDKDHYAKTGRSLLTGMRGVQHVGRPKFDQILSQLRELHTNDLIRVYSCGPPKLQESVDDARDALNATLPSSRHIEHVSSYFYT